MRFAYSNDKKVVSVFVAAYCFVRQHQWWTDYKTKLALWATQFKDQEDVWIEVWNEPYRFGTELMDSQILFGCRT
jgi:hypothetical protein